MDQQTSIGTPEPDSSAGEPQVQPDAAGDTNAATAAGEQTKKSSIVALKDGLDLFGKLIFGLAGLCYVLGVVVVTIHLRRYGVNSLDLPQLHYVTAGVWVVLPIAFITTFTIFGIFLASTQTEQMRRGRSLIDKITFAVSTVLVLILIARIFWGGIGVEFSWKSVIWVPLIGMLAALLIFAGAFSLRSVARTTPFREAVPLIGTLIVGLLMFTVYVYLFAQYTYQSIPWATGGGRASMVRLFITPDSMPYVQGLKIALAPPKDGIVETDSIKLLLTTEKQLVVINADGKAVSLPADLVKGIAYEK